MRFQALFELIQCWRAPNIVRKTVPSIWGCDDERTLAEQLLQTSERDDQSAVISCALSKIFYVKGSDVDFISEMCERYCFDIEVPCSVES